MVVISPSAETTVVGADRDRWPGDTGRANGLTLTKPHTAANRSATAIFRTPRAICKVGAIVGSDDLSNDSVRKRKPCHLVEPMLMHMAAQATMGSPAR